MDYDFTITNDREKKRERDKDYHIICNIYYIYLITCILVESSIY